MVASSNRRREARVFVTVSHMLSANLRIGVCKMCSQDIAYAILPSPDHNLQGHPENVGRFKHFGELKKLPFSDRLREIPIQGAPLSTIASVHPAAYLEALQQAAAQGPGFVDYGDTYVTSDSYRAALRAAGASIHTIDAVAKGEAKSGFAMVRPPGHHATFTRPMGFCLLNNIAIATRHTQQLGHQRVMIVDFDVHHGNGTQEIFQEDPDVLYISTHQAGIYPGTGLLGDVGKEAGEGSVVNIPLPARAGDNAFQSIYELVIAPLASRFLPQFILVSAGFDAHWNDPLANLQLSTNGFFRIGQALNALADSVCQGRIVYFLEGGYDPIALSDSIFAIFSALAGTQPTQDRRGEAPFPEPDISDLITNVKHIHAL
jgi:acetoin utilization deacetylase AcuC-like enzyme